MVERRTGLLRWVAGIASIAIVGLAFVSSSDGRVEYEPQPPVCTVLRQAGGRGACGSSVLKFQGSVAPRRLPDEGPVPVTVGLALRIDWTEPPAAPPALKELTFEFDRSLVARGQSQSSCPRSRAISQPYGSLRARCRSAILGDGSVLLENEAERFSTLPLTLFAAGGPGASPPMVIRAPAGALSPKPLIAPVELARSDSDRFGYKARIPVPKIAGGTIAIRHLRMRIGAAPGRGQSAAVFSATCPRSRRIVINLAAELIDGERLGSEVIRSCVGGSH